MKINGFYYISTILVLTNFYIVAGIKIGDDPDFALTQI